MNYFGDAAGNERSAGASSSRKGKKSNSNKPRQPQRGLGVAQLEKIRLNHLEFYPSNLHPQVQIFQLNPPRIILSFCLVLGSGALVLKNTFVL
ncbi:putative SPEAR family protein [Helianthus annuus]|nr:putative SPEAR family protein [Helianthus annuus]